MDINEYRKKHNFPNESELKADPLLFMAEEENVKCHIEINKSKATDEIHLTRESDKMLIDIWTDSSNVTTHVQIPSDILFAGTVPLLDCIINIDERNYSDSLMLAPGQMCKYRVAINSDYNDIVSYSISTRREQVIGYVIRYNIDGQFISPIYILAGNNHLSFPERLGYKNMSDETKSAYKEFYTHTYVLANCIYPILVTWYGLQISLLHPLTKIIYEKPSRVKLNLNAKTGKSTKKNKVKYIKSHTIKSDEFATLIYGEGSSDNKINRKALVWYVIGHWRKLKNGKTVFVSPHYKGTMKNVKTAVDLREREIAQLEVNPILEILEG